ncbi:MAG TPA: EamA family transporter, partial [Acidimicrobiales bacterium]|nr:EamA family transporter [Acidimicrobiales bacterium]
MNLRADLALAGAAFLFGTTFLVMQGAVEDVEPIPFIAVRFGIGALALVPIALARRAAWTGVARWGAAAGMALGAG